MTRLQVYKVYLLAWTAGMVGMLLWVIVARKQLVQTPNGFILPLLILMLGNTIGSLIRKGTPIQDIEW